MLCLERRHRSADSFGVRSFLGKSTFVSNELPSSRVLDWLRLCVSCGLEARSPNEPKLGPLDATETHATIARRHETSHLARPKPTSGRLGALRCASAKSAHPVRPDLSPAQV